MKLDSQYAFEIDDEINIYRWFYIVILFMKKLSGSSQGSDKSQEPGPPRREKQLITFEYKELHRFISNDKQPTDRQMPSPKRRVARPAPPPKQLVVQKEDLKAPLSQLRIPRKNRGKIPSNSHQAFNNSILLLEYETHDDADHFSREKRQSPKSQQQNQVVKDVVKACMRVITEDTQHSISARYASNHSTPSHRLSPLVQMVQMIPHEDVYFYNMMDMTKVPPIRNRKQVSSQESKAFFIDLAKVEIDGRTTIMVRNIPNKYTQDMLLELFEKNHKKKFDFFYLPIDHNNTCNVGYAFLNFIHTKFITQFYLEFNQRKWNKFNSVKVCQVCYARIQGTAQLQHHFQHSNVLQQKDKRYRPLIGLKNLVQNPQNQLQKEEDRRIEEYEQEEK